MARLSVLFVDDSDLDVMLAVRALRAAGYEVRYERVERAADLAARLPGDWDVVVCDHQMPEFDALSALRVHRESGADLPFLIVSGAIPDALAIDAMREGARDFIHKDNLLRLAPAIERELRDARNRELLRQTQASVDRLLHDDLLTGLGNLDALMQRLAAAVAAGRPFALFLVDLNRFRRITQTLGLVAGNRILRVAAMRLGALIDDQGFAARTGMDRFALLLPGLADEHAVLEFGRAVHEALLAPVTLDDQDIVLTAGVGAAVFPAHGYRADALLRAAEAALESAKRAGLHEVALYDPAMGGRERNSLVLGRALQRAAAGREFVLHFQPQVALESGRPVGVEALLRWQDSGRGLVPPGEFIRQLEDSGLILEVGDWVLGEAIRQLRAWRDDGVPAPRIAVNLSALQFRQAGLVDRLAELLGEAGVPAGDLELEITERVAMGNEESTIAILSALKTLGVRLAIDDFGTGYSSLAYLRHFPVDCLKIDRSFLRRDGGADGLDAARAAVALGERLRLSTLAEGVETPEQAAALRDGGCLNAQGFHFARPLSAEACAAYLRQWA